MSQKTGPESLIYLIRDHDFLDLNRIDLTSSKRAVGFIYLIISEVILTFCHC